MFFLNDPLRMFYYVVKELSETITNIVLKLTADKFNSNNLIRTADILNTFKKY